MRDAIRSALSADARTLISLVIVGGWIILFSSPQAHALAAWLIGGIPQ
jgi:hypothetical protein